MPKRLVLDANIILRGVFGRHVFHLLEAYEDKLASNTPDVCLEQAERYLPQIAAQRGSSLQSAKGVLAEMVYLLAFVDRGFYEPFEVQAQSRIAARDPDDWPIVATALALDCPIWTEDHDFFGTGIATWNTANIEHYLRNA